MGSSTEPSSAAGDSTRGGWSSSSYASRVEPDLLFGSSEYTDIQRGIAWFKLTFGCLFLVVGVVSLARFFYVRNVFEIKARSPYLVLLHATSLLGVIGSYTYQAGVVLFGFPLDIEGLYVATFTIACTLFGSFWGRVFRLGVAYCPRVKRRLPWLMLEKLWVSFSLLFGLVGAIDPLYRAKTINDPFASLYFVPAIQEDEVVWQWVLLGISIALAPVVWPIDDLFGISREMLAVIGVQTFQTLGTYLTEKYASVDISYWLNNQNFPFVGSVIVFGLIVINPIRWEAFHPISRTRPALARAYDRRREEALRALKMNNLSEITAPTEFNFSPSTKSSATDTTTPKKNKWCYETLAQVPELAASFRAFAFRALCQESVIFLEEVSRFQRGHFSMCPAGKKSQHHAFVEIVARFIVDGSPEEINISHGRKKKFLELSRNDAERFGMLDEAARQSVFAEVYVDVRYMLETNLLQRFMDTIEFNEKVSAPAVRGRGRCPKIHSTADDRLSFRRSVDEEQPQPSWEDLPSSAV